MSRSALAVTLGGVAAARSAATVADRAARCLNLLRPLITARHRDAVARLADLDRLVAAAAAAPDLAAFIAELTLDPPASTSTSPGRRIWTRTTWCCPRFTRRRGWSGRSCTCCTLPTERSRPIWPSDQRKGLLEEQRLFYVAVTRAADELSLYAPLRMPHHRFGGNDKHSFAQLTRFLDDAAQQTLSVTDLTPARAAPVSPRPAPTRVELPALDELWA